MDTENIVNVIKTSVLARERLVGGLEIILEDKIRHIDTSLGNTDFLQDAKNAILTSLQEFKQGEEITMNCFSDYSCTKAGSKGRVLSQQDDKITVNFYYQTGKNPPNQSDTWTVDKYKACKTKFYSLLAELKDYGESAKKIMGKAIENIDLTGVYPDIAEKLVDKDKVCLINDNALLEEVKQDSLYFKRICLEGARKYLRGTGVVNIVIEITGPIPKNSYLLQGKNIEKILQEKDYSDYDSAKLAQAESSQELAELSIMEEAKKVNANYVLINQKHILSSDDRTLTTVVEGLPFMIIGKQEVENLLNKPHLEEEVITAIKNFIPLKIIRSNYTCLAKCYPEEFITFFSGIKSVEQKKLIIESLMKTDYDNKEVIAWLDENESGLVREVGLNLD